MGRRMKLLLGAIFGLLALCGIAVAIPFAVAHVHGTVKEFQPAEVKGAVPKPEPVSRAPETPEPVAAPPILTVQSPVPTPSPPNAPDQECVPRPLADGRLWCDAVPSTRALFWESQGLPNGKRTAAAKDVCPSLKAGGFRWRLPTDRELHHDLCAVAEEDHPEPLGSYWVEPDDAGNEQSVTLGGQSGCISVPKRLDYKASVRCVRRDP